MSENEHSSFFHIIPDEVLRSKTLSPQAKLLYAAICGLARKCGYCYASDQYLSDNIGIKVRQTQVYIKELEDRGYIKRDTKKNGVLWDRKIRLCVDFKSKNVCEYTETSTLEQRPEYIKTASRDHSDRVILEEERIEEERRRVECEVATAPSVVAKAPTLPVTFSPVGEEREPSAEAVRLAQNLLQKIRVVNPKFKEPQLVKWALELDKAHRIDKRSWEDLDAVLERVFQDEFWSTNILSATKLRKHFDRVYALISVKNTKPSWVNVNRANAYEALQSIKNDVGLYRDVLIGNNSIERLQSGSILSFDMHPKEFEAKMCKMLGLRIKNG